MIREAGISRIEICGLHPPTHYDYHDTAQLSEIGAECHKLGASIVAIHGPNLPYGSPYEEVRRAVVKEGVASARAAKEMGASVFVAHFGTTDCSARTVRDMIECLDGVDIMLAVENLPGIPLGDYLDFVDRIACDRFGMALDIGHLCEAEGGNSFVKLGRAREAMAPCEHRLFHLHLHDTVDSDHYPPFDGNVRWDEVFSALQEINYRGEFMFEATARISLEDTLKKTAAFPKEFALRYGR
jgi:sugar phosphate isomerase/epimerase